MRYDVRITSKSLHPLHPLEQSDGERTSLRVAYLIVFELGRRLTRAIDEVAGPGVSSNADIAALLRLRQGPARPRDLIETTGLSSAGVSALCDRLKGRGLITRGRSVNDDARGVAIELSPTGRELARRIMAAIRNEFDAQATLRFELVQALGSRPPPVSSLSAGSDHVIELMARVGTEVIEAIRGNTFTGDPSPGVTVLVLAAAFDGSIRPRDLIGMTDLSSGGVTLLVDRLEDAGLVWRVNGDSGDRRSVSVVPTPEGQAALERCLDRFAPLAGAIAAAFC